MDSMKPDGSTRKRNHAFDVFWIIVFLAFIIYDSAKDVSSKRTIDRMIHESDSVIWNRDSTIAIMTPKADFYDSEQTRYDRLRKKYMDETKLRDSVAKEKTQKWKK